MKIPVYLKVPAHRGTAEVALALALLQLAGALWAMVWQAGVIAYQREIILLLARDLNLLK